MWPPTGLIPWFSKTEGNTYATFLHRPFLFKGKPTLCSRGSKKDFWRRCRGFYAKVSIPSTHHKLLSPALYYLPFASRFPLPHFTLAVLFALSLSPSSLSFSIRFFLLVSCLLVCRIACLSRWLKIIPNYVTLPIPTIMISLALRLLLLPILNLVKSMLLC